MTTATRDLLADTSERFAANTANHTMTALHDDGLYRHLRFAQPDRSGYWFEIVTWPGSLAVRGDMGGGYVFSRQTDMFEFFRRNGNDHGINPGYWSEKLGPTEIRATTKEYSEEQFRSMVEPYLVEYEQGGYKDRHAKYLRDKAAYDATPFLKRWPLAARGPHEPSEPKTPTAVREMVSDADDDGDLGHEDGARSLLRDLERSGVVRNTQEWDLSDWTYPYLWCCHAIVWGIGQYDAARKPAEVAP